MGILWGLEKDQNISNRETGLQEIKDSNREGGKQLLPEHWAQMSAEGVQL